MRVPFSWLKEYCDPGLSAEEVADLLSMRTADVERVIHTGVPDAAGFVVGRVVSAEQHPNADRLRVCEVETGDGVQTIVCGAPNVAAGQTVAVALPGARMPGGEKLKKAKLRGIESNGMILSERELGLSDEHEGILVLSADPPARGREAEEAGGTLVEGRPLADLVPIQDEVLDLDLNPNRVDLLGVYGVAREVHAITGAPLAPAPWEGDAEAAGEGSVEQLASVRVEVPELCPRFTARAFTGVEIAPSPLWMKARLMAAGQRPISNVVDVTNYVMLLTAQPLHAFDLDKVPGGEVIVRSAKDGERMTTLDGTERTFDSETVLVCDRDGPTGIAGIMGGQVSEVEDSTTRVLLEAANWNGTNTLRTSSKLGLRSEASARFEKGLHPEIAMRGQIAGSKLLVELGAELVPGTIDESAEIPARHVISLHGARTEALLGVAVDAEAASENLGRLGFDVTAAGEGELEVTTPYHRHSDVTREVDVIEEVGRLEGFDRLPRTLPADPERVGGLSREQVLRRRAEDVLRDAGFDEVVTWSFVAPGLSGRLRIGDGDPRSRAISTANPISAEHQLMRTTLLGGLLDTARHNLARGRERIAVFESGRVFLRAPAPAAGGPLAGEFAGPLPAPAHEPTRLGGLLVGPLTPPTWAGAPPDADARGFFSLKGVLELLATELEVAVGLERAEEPFLHPGQAAALLVDGSPAGWLGELHPSVAAEWDLQGAAAFELDLAPLLAASAVGTERYEDLTTHPAVLQDIAVVVSDEVGAGEVRAAVIEAGGKLLAGAEVFDVYRGDQVGAGRKSLALRLEFRAPDRTLTDEEVAVVRGRIEESLGAIGGELRE